MIRLQNVSYSYKGGLEPTLQGVSLEIMPGESVGLVGHTGSGKSTLVQLMSGLLKADEGEIWLGDMQLTAAKRPKSGEICQKVGIVFQYAEDQLFAETVREELGYAPRNLGWQENEIKRAVERTAAQFGIENLLNANPYELSGGEMRKVALASVLIMQPELLILDEPFVGLDAGARRNLLKVLTKWQKKSNAAIVCVSHDIEQLVKFCSRLLVMKSGRLVLDREIRRAFDEVELLAESGVYPPIGRQATTALGTGGNALTIEEAAREITLGRREL